MFTYIYHKNQPNVGEHTVHGSYGLWGLRNCGNPLVQQSKIECEFEWLLP